LITETGREKALLSVDYSRYGAFPVKGSLRVICDRHLRRAKRPLPAGVLLMSWFLRPGEEQHLAFYTGEGTIIHAHNAIGKCIEHEYDAKYVRLTRGLFVIPGVTGYDEEDLWPF